jgi:hypothetical protein
LPDLGLKAAEELQSLQQPFGPVLATLDGVGMCSTLTPHG